MAHVPGKALGLSLLALGLAITFGMAVTAQPPALPAGPPGLPASPPGPPSPPPATIGFQLPPPTVAKPRPDATQPPPPSTPPAVPAQTTPTVAKEEFKLDQPLSWLFEARRNYTLAVKDYSCTFIKTERIRGVLQEEHIIKFYCKAQPFSVYMKWQTPKSLHGQEVCYVEGKNNGKMRVRKKGFVGTITDFVSIPVNDHRAMDHSRHKITEAGIGNLIEQCLASMQVERQLNKTVVSVGEHRFDNRPCLRIEMVRPHKGEAYYCFRSVLVVDKESKIPIRMENYDWPVPGGSQTGELLERFSYVDINFNTGLRDEFFVK